jgi:hypothetical protein
MHHPFCLLPLTLVAALSAQETGLPASVCRVSFSYPATWELITAAETGDSLGGCSASLRPKDWARRLVEDDSLDAHSIHVAVDDRSVDDALESAGFEQAGSRWFVTGPAGSRDSATAISGPGWRGAYGITGCRCFRLGEDGGSVFCEQPFAVLGTARRSATILGGVASEETVVHLLATFRFEP